MSAKTKEKKEKSETEYTLTELTTMFSVALRVIVQTTTYDNEGNVKTLVGMKMKAITEGHYFKCEECRNTKTICNHGLKGSPGPNP